MQRSAEIILRGLGSAAVAALFSLSALAGVPAIGMLLTAPVSQQALSSVVIGSAGCSGTSCSFPNIATALPSGAYIGTLSTTLNPPAPVFSGSYQLVASGGSCSGGDTTHFQISGDAVEVNGSPSASTYTICVEATELGHTLTQGFTITVGNLINAATTYCAANGGGTGSSGSPWTGACIQAAVNAAHSGDTVFLAAGNWDLIGTSGYAVSQPINLVGAASGNTFDVYGHPNNGYCNTVSSTGPGNDACLPAGFTHVYGDAARPGFLSFQNCTGNVTVAHIFFDGSVGYDGGGDNATLNFQNCPNALVNDIRLWAWTGINGSETQFYIYSSNGITVENSVLAMPPVVNGGFYPNTSPLQSQETAGTLVTNNLFYQNSYNGIYQDSVTFTGNQMYLIEDASGTSGITGGFGPDGCSPGGVCINGGTTGDYHFYFMNNYFDSSAIELGLGGGVNDPTTGGQVNDLEWTGNWAFSPVVSIASCIWHVIGDCPSGQLGNSAGMQINCASSPCNDQFLVTNNSLIATGTGSEAILDATGTGLQQSNAEGTATFTGSISGGTLSVSGVSGTIAIGQYVGVNLNNGGSTQVAPNTKITAGSGTSWTVNVSQTVASEPMASGENNTVYGFNATKNYLSSSSNQYLTDVNSISPVESTNYCTGGSSSFSGCNTTGFTTAPTCSFTLGALSGSTVPITATSFTAQYGAVQWITSTSPTTPTSSDSRWNYSDAGNGGDNSYIPPASLSGVSHGDMVYMWVMDSASHISAPATVLIP